ncbi:hypothetical protein CE91St41_04580 [Oscillospiraceae bacterium]|nr:hypothetical protein CE91St40_04600 [Oscillospiraceae bacterium]BDF73569.1 hypothetical protein CE91St41_04580 [Oscillospiraceae bacterium]
MTLFDAIFSPKPHPAPLYNDYILGVSLLNTDASVAEILQIAFSMMIKCVNHIPQDISYIDGFIKSDYRDSELWSILADDVITSLLINFRHKLEAPMYGLSELCGPKDDLGNMSKKLKHCMPAILNEAIGASLVINKGAQKTATQYPNLVSTLIRNSVVSCFSKEDSTRLSWAYNKRFYCNCLSDIIMSEDTADEPRKLPSYSKEEIFILERLFSLELYLMMLDHGQLNSKELKLIFKTLQYLSNATTRYPIYQFLNTQLDKNIGAIEFCLKLIGSFIFPAWQSTTCEYLCQRFQPKTEKSLLELIGALETAQNMLGNKLDNTYLNKQRERKAPKRKMKETYSKSLKENAVNWWDSRETVCSALTGYADDVNNRYFRSLLLDESFFRKWYFLPVHYEEDDFNNKYLGEDQADLNDDIYGIEYFEF